MQRATTLMFTQPRNTSNKHLDLSAEELGNMSKRIVSSLHYAALGDALGGGVEMVKDQPHNMAEMVANQPQNTKFVNLRSPEKFAHAYHPGWVTDDSHMTRALIMAMLEDYSALLDPNLKPGYTIAEIYDSPAIKKLLAAQDREFRLIDKEVYEFAETLRDNPEAYRMAIPHPDLPNHGYGQIGIQYLIKGEDELKLAKSLLNEGKHVEALSLFASAERIKREGYEKMHKNMRDMDLANNQGNKQPGNVAPMHVWAVGLLPNKNDIQKIVRTATLSVQDNHLSIDCSTIIALATHQFFYAEELDHQNLIRDLIDELSAMPALDNEERSKNARLRLIAYLQMLDMQPGFDSSHAIDMPENVFSNLCEGNTALMFNETAHGLNPKVLYTIGVILYILKHHTAETKLTIALARLLAIGGDVDSSSSIGMGILAARYAEGPADDIRQTTGLKHLLQSIVQKDKVLETANEYRKFVILKNGLNPDSVARVEDITVRARLSS